MFPVTLVAHSSADNTINSHCHFATDPRLYQEIKERGLQSSSLGPDDDDFNQMPEEDQGIVVKTYKAAYVTWSQLPQVKRRQEQEAGMIK